MTALKVVSWPGRAGDLNPFIEVFVDSLEAAGCDVTGIKAFPNEEFPAEADAFVIHWPQFIYSEAYGYIAKVRTLLRFIRQLRALKKRGVRIIWLAHDLMPHDWDAMRWQLLWWPTIRSLLLLADGVIALSPGTCAQIEREHSRWIRGRLTWAWHPWYEDVLVSDETAAETRAQLGISQNIRVIGFFGQLRGQKGLEDLVAAFRYVKDSDIHLLIAGAPSKSAPEIAQLVEHAASEDDRIHTILRELTDEEVKKVVAATDVCAFPYRRYTHSGAMIYSLSAHRPIVTPRTLFSQSLADLHPEWIHLYEGRLGMEALMKCVRQADPNPSPDLRDFAPTNLAAKVVELTASE